MLKKWTAIGILAAVIIMLGGMFGTALASEGGAAASSSGLAGAAVAAGIGICIASFGGAFAQGRTASAALEGISRNPGAADKMFVPMVLGLVLIESLVIYTLVVAIMILGKV